ncbi:MAG: oligosaccharide flippase family protein [Anaerolineales bacterium]|nr:oligosaccharide flippase family protein [Anaerolineales bacterium]
MDLELHDNTPIAYRAVRGGVWVALSSYWTIGFGFLVTIALTRVLSPEAFGQYAYALFYANLLSLSPKLGLKYAFIQHKETNAEVLGTYLVLEFLAISASLLLTILISSVLPSSVMAICLVLALTAFANLGGVGALLLDKELRLGRTSLIESIVIPVSYVPAFIFALQGGGAWSLVTQVVTQRILTLGVYLWLLRPQLPQLLRAHQFFDRRLAWHFLQMGLTIGLSTFVSGLTVDLDNFLIGRFVGEKTLGYYDRARRISHWPSTLLTNMVSRTSLYTYTKIQDEAEKLNKAVTLVSWAITLLGFLTGLTIFITASDLVRLLYGQEWLSSVPYLEILIFVSVVLPLLENMSTLFTAIGKPKVILWTSIIQVGIMAVVGLPLTLTWGALGTCIAAVLAVTGKIMVIFWAMRRQLGFRSYSTLLVPVAASGLTLICYQILQNWIEFDQFALLLRVVAKSLVSVTLYTLFAFGLHPKTLKDRVGYIGVLLKGERMPVNNEEANQQ